MSCRVNRDTCRGVSILICIRESEKSAQRMILILGMNIPRGVPKGSISSPSPNSLSYQEIWRAQYPQYNICNTMWRQYDGGHKNGIALLFFFHFFFSTWFASLSCTASKGVRFCFSFFSLLFGENVGRIFLEPAIYAHLWKTKKLTLFESFGCTLRELHINFLSERRKFALGKSSQIQHDPLGRTSSYK